MTRTDQLTRLAEKFADEHGKEKAVPIIRSMYSVSRSEAYKEFLHSYFVGFLACAELLMPAVEMLEEYASCSHFEFCGLPENEPENPSGEPNNIMCGGLDGHEYQYENGGMARATLSDLDKKLEGVE